MKFQNFSIAKIEFLWRALNFKRGHGPPGPPFSAAYVSIRIYQRNCTLALAKAIIAILPFDWTSYVHFFINFTCVSLYATMYERNYKFALAKSLTAICHLIVPPIHCFRICNWIFSKKLRCQTIIIPFGMYSGPSLWFLSVQVIDKFR